MRMKMTAMGMLAGALLASGLVGGAAGVRADDPPPTKLAVVNIVQVFAALNEQKANAADLDQMRRDLNDQGRKMQDDLDKKSKELQDYKEGTADYKQLQDEVIDLGMKVEVFSQVSEQKLLYEQKIRTVAVYIHMNDEIQQYAKANGIGLVFVTDDPDFSTAKTTQDVLSRITVRKIMYAAPPYDITKQVIEDMNTKFQLPPAPKAP